MITSYDCAGRPCPLAVMDSASINVRAKNFCKLINANLCIYSSNSRSALKTVSPDHRQKARSNSAASNGHVFKRIFDSRDEFTRQTCFDDIRRGTGVAGGTNVIFIIMGRNDHNPDLRGSCLQVDRYFDAAPE